MGRLNSVLWQLCRGVLPGMVNLGPNYLPIASHAQLTPWKCICLLQAPNECIARIIYGANLLIVSS